jgi:hypothetical protein
VVASKTSLRRPARGAFGLLFFYQRLVREVAISVFPHPEAQTAIVLVVTVDHGSAREMQPQPSVRTFNSRL